MKIEQYFLQMYRAGSIKSECPRGKSESAENTFISAFIKNSQDLVPDNEKELVGQVVRTALEEIKKCAYLHLRKMNEKN